MRQATFEAHTYEYEGLDPLRTRSETIHGLLVALQYLASECQRNDLPEVADLTHAAAEVCKEALETPNEATARCQPD